MKCGSRREKIDTGNYRHNFCKGNYVEFEDGKYFISGFRSNSMVLKKNLRNWKEVTSRSPNKLKLIHRFKSLLVQETLIPPITKVIGFIEV
jgi:hypothetical protein